MPNTKRRRDTAPAHDRPTKQLKAQAGTATNGSSMVESDGSATPMDGRHLQPNGDYSSDLEDTQASVVPIAAAENAEWQKTIEKVVRNVVSIHFCQTCSFDTDAACSSEATGFVVDAERGYILTNRHVACAGPFWGYAIFDNHEECDVYPIYRDPVHDFGILRFDPKAIKYMPLEDLKLRPDLARVGAEVRVVGNDAGEKLSILSGVISRLDRNAPEYGEGYSDFNTNYIQAAAAATGGSSGSPVVNVDGHAVALQAGGRFDGAATDYFLPLDRPLRALQCLQNGEHVSRGTIQTQWMMKPFDECRRLGLKPEWEALVRKEFPKETNMLVAEIILPEGPADGKILEGDVLIKVNGELHTKFVPLDAILDSSVGKKINLLLQRGGEDVEVELDVGDLHAITPDRFVTVAGGSFHDLSYQQARLYAVAVRGVYICEAGGSFRFESTDSGWIVESIDHQKTPDLATFIKVVSGIRDKARVVVTYKHLRDLHTLNTSIIQVDRHWSSKMRMAVRNDKTGLWDFKDVSDPLPPAEPERKSAEFAQLDAKSYPGAAEIVNSFVRVTCTMPVKLDGFPRARKIGHGLVVNAEKGLVMVSRAIVPYDLCDLSITIADSIILEGKVVFLHPVANYAIVQYDPSLVDAPVKSAKLSSEYIKQGASTVFLGFNQNLRIVHAKTTVTDITTVAIPANTAAPRYRALNLDAITVDTGLSGACGTGVLLQEDGTVDAIWMTYLGERSHGGKDNEYHLGLATPSLIPVIEQVSKGEVPNLRILDMELNTVQMSQARIMGVSDHWIKEVAKANPARHQLFMVRKADCPASPDARASPLLEGDILLTLNGQLITNPHDLDIMYDKDVLEAQIIREGKELTLSVPTISTVDLSTDHALLFCGAILHAPHHAVRQQISKLHSHVYVSARTRGSPAYMYGLAPTNFITAVNGKPVRTLDEFKTATAKIPDNTYFRLRLVTFDNVPLVATMKKNEHYFPTMEFVRDIEEQGGIGKWEKKTVKGAGMVEDETGVKELGSEIMDEGPGMSDEYGDGNEST